MLLERQRGACMRALLRKASIIVLHLLSFAPLIVLQALYHDNPRFLILVSQVLEFCTWGVGMFIFEPVPVHHGRSFSIRSSNSISWLLVFLYEVLTAKHNHGA